MDAVTRRLVRARAGDRCEYCHLRQIDSPLASLEIKHVIPKKHHGDDTLANLALACIHCNCHKGSNISGIDPDTGRMTRLFHPRNDEWDDHFYRQGPVFIGKTDVGRTTVDVLKMNADDRVQLRAASDQDE